MPPVVGANLSGGFPWGHAVLHHAHPWHHPRAGKAANYPAQPGIFTSLTAQRSMNDQAPINTISSSLVLDGNPFSAQQRVVTPILGVNHLLL